MTRNRLKSFFAPFTLAFSVYAQLPYNPARLILSPDGARVYQFSPQTSPYFTVIDVQNEVQSTEQGLAGPSAPFDPDDGNAYTHIGDSHGINVLSGNCQVAQDAAKIWRFEYGTKNGNGSWSTLDFSSEDKTLALDWLATGFSFSPSSSNNDTGLYIFGGMCPLSDAQPNTWTSDATYSNTLVTAVPAVDQKYSLSGQRSPPVAEAGLSITPLSAVVSKSSTGKMSQNQNFVLLGGHTQTAFINMSQVAIFSLPEGAWAFKGVSQPDSVQGELLRRDDSMVEPRSGHTAVLSPDGSKIYVLGGWVGDVTNPANPQMAVLNMGDEYGSEATWSWQVPSQNGNPFSSGIGIYGHGAVMLDGGVMMVAGGTIIGEKNSKRTVQSLYFYNTTSATWTSSYENPHHGGSNMQAGNSGSSRKAGLGAGLGVGLALAALAAILGYLYARRRKQQRLERERRLRAMALGSGRFQSGSQISGVHGRQTGVRSPSWGSVQEKQMESIGQALPWPPSAYHGQMEPTNEDMYVAERTGLDMHAPSPTRGLRRSLHSRGPAGFGNHFGVEPVGPGSVFRIDEEEEERSLRSMRPNTSLSRRSDPFKDPPIAEIVDRAAEERKKEVKSWMEDWQSAAMTLSRNPSQARTYSNLSQAHSSSQSGSDRTGRVSPDKSDRTNSNLSDRSNVSNQSSVGMPLAVTRTLSQRSVSAGYALFAGAAAAMGRFSGANKEDLQRSASKRSVSLHPNYRPGRPKSSDGQALLRGESPTKSENGKFFTPPESPIKDYKNYARTSSFTNQGRGRARGVLGSMKRVFTGTSQVDVDARVEGYEEKEREAQEETPDMLEVTPNTPTMQFWQGKRGAKDWDHDDDDAAGSSTIKHRSAGRSTDDLDAANYDSEEWDIETAVQKRVVQVMFTVPKEKLRVVNADSLSLISRSDTGDREDDRDVDVKRMSSVNEGDEGDTTSRGKETRLV